MNDMRLTERAVDSKEIKIAAHNVQVYYGDTHAIKDVNVEILDRTVTAFIGPSGCGKSTFLRTLNRIPSPDRKSTRLPRGKSPLMARISTISASIRCSFVRK